MTNNNLKPTAFNYGGDILKSVGNVSDKLGVSPTAAPKKVAVSVPKLTPKLEVKTPPTPTVTGAGQTSETQLQEQKIATRNDLVSTREAAGRMYGDSASKALQSGAFNPSKGTETVSFRGQTNALLDTKDNMDVLKDWMVETRNTGKVNDKMKSIVGPKAYSEISAFRERLKSMEWLYKGKAEGNIEGFTAGQGKNVALVGDLPAELLSRGASYISEAMGNGPTPTFREAEQIKQELEAQGEYKPNDIARTAGMVQETLTGYSAFGKVVDKAIVSTKVSSKFNLINEAQKSLKTSYVNNPKMFNLVSNTAQEAIEYGVRKTIGDKTYTFNDFLGGVLAGGIASRMFGKVPEDVRTLVSTKDYNKLSNAIEEAKINMPGVEDDMIFEGIKDMKLPDSGMTVGEMKQAFEARPATTTKSFAATTPSAIKTHFIDNDVYVSSAASRKLSEVINSVNEQASKSSPMQMDIKLNGKGDLMGFKNELVSSMKTTGVNTKADVEELITSLSKKYGVNPGKKDSPIIAMDAIEEAMLRPNAAITNLANPKTIDNLFSQFGHPVPPKVNLDSVFKTQESLSHLLTHETPTANQLDAITDKKSRLDEVYKQFGISSNAPTAFKQLENVIYKVPKDIGDERGTFLKQAKQLTQYIEDGLASLSKKTSSSKDIEMERVFAMQQIGELMNDKGNYVDSLKKAQTVLDNLLSLSTKNVTEKGLISNEIMRDARLKNTMRAIEEEAPETAYDLTDNAVLRGASNATNVISNGSVQATDYWKAINTPYRVLRDALGDGTAFKSFVRDPMQAESNWIKQTYDLRGNVNKLFDASGLGADANLHKKFSIWMVGRRASDVAGSVDPRESVKRAGNLRIDEAGNIINTREIGWKKDVVGKAKQLTDGHIADIEIEMNKYVSNNPKAKELVDFLDGEFATMAEKTNAFLKENDNVIINPLKRYFPIRKYRVGVRTNVNEESMSMDDMFKSHINDGFLDSLKKVDNQDSFDLEVDLPTIMKGYENSQLYWLNMKPEVDKMERLLGIRKENANTFIEGNVERTQFSAFSPRLQEYMKTHIDNIKERGVINEDPAIKAVANIVSNAVTYSTLGANPFSIAAQALSVYDSAMMRKTFKYVNKWDGAEAAQYSGPLRQRMTEASVGLTTGDNSLSILSNPFAKIGDILSRKDLQEQSLYGKSKFNKVTENVMLGIKKMDAATSSIVWHAAFYDKLTRDYSNISSKMSLSQVEQRIGEVEMSKLVNYADGEMNNIMFQGSSIVNKPQIAKKFGSVYSLHTLLMKTMLNRTFFINDAWKHSSVSKLEQAAYIGVVAGLDAARTAASSYNNVLSGEKEEYAFYDTNVTNIVSWMEGNKSTEELGETERLILNTAGTIVGSYFGGVQGYNPYDLFRKVRDEDRRQTASPDMPTNRKAVGMGEAAIQTALPGTMKSLVPIAHRAVTGEPLFQTRNENAALSSKLKDDVSNQSIVSGMSWKEQGGVAEDYLKVKDQQKEINSREKIKNDMKNIIVEEVVKQYGVPSAKEFAEYIKTNKEKFKTAGVTKGDDIEKLFKSITPEDVTKRGLDVYSNLPQNAEVIYGQMLSKYVLSRDQEGFNAEVKKLQEKGIIKDVKGFAKKVGPLIQKDKEKRKTQQ